MRGTSIGSFSRKVSSTLVVSKPCRGITVMNKISVIQITYAFGFLNFLKFFPLL